MEAVRASPDPNALLCALILAPGTYSRNRFFDLFEASAAREVRRRARRVRSIVVQLTDPWPPRGGREGGEPRARIVTERVLDDGRVQLHYRVDDLNLSRVATLEPLEAAALRYALHRAGRGEVHPTDRRLVENALQQLCADPVAAFA
jgi:hypothetical protein